MKTRVVIEIESPDFAKELHDKTLTNGKEIF